MIIGGTSGIGLDLARLLLSEGYRVVSVSRKGSIISESELLTAIQADFTLPGSSPDFFDGSLDGFVYCPGTIRLKPFHRLTDEDFLGDFTINVLGGVRAFRWALPALKRGHLPSVVFISTVAVTRGMPFHSSIAAAKGGLEGLTRSLAAELAPDIRVNAVAPSLTDTPLAERLLATPESRKQRADGHPLKRTGQPGDISAMIRFLLGPDSGWITGQIFHVDGGLSVI